MGAQRISFEELDVGTGVGGFDVDLDDLDAGIEIDQAGAGDGVIGHIIAVSSDHLHGQGVPAKGDVERGDEGEQRTFFWALEEAKGFRCLVEPSSYGSMGKRLGMKGR